jgi:hypothetical protein
MARAPGATVSVGRKVDINALADEFMADFPSVEAEQTEAIQTSVTDNKDADETDAAALAEFDEELAKEDGEETDDVKDAE